MQRWGTLLVGIIVLCILLLPQGSTAQPVSCGSIEEPVGAILSGAPCLPFGARFSVRLLRFDPGEVISVFMTTDAGLVGGADRSAMVGIDGTLAPAFDTANFYGTPLEPNDYILFVKDIQGNHGSAIVPFRVLPSSATAQPRPSATVTRVVPPSSGATAVPTPAAAQTSTWPEVETPAPPSALTGQPATARPTATSSPTPTVASTATPTVTPSTGLDRCQRTPTEAEADDSPLYPVSIKNLDKAAETVTLVNVTSDPIDLTGWTLCSVGGGQRHERLGGVLGPKQSLTFKHQGSSAIWDDDRRDDAALYDPAGQLISYWYDYWYDA